MNSKWGIHELNEEYMNYANEISSKPFHGVASSILWWQLWLHLWWCLYIYTESQVCQFYLILYCFRWQIGDVWCCYKQWMTWETWQMSSVMRCREDRVVHHQHGHDCGCPGCGDRDVAFITVLGVYCSCHDVYHC